MATFQEALLAKKHLVKRWKRMPGVIGIGIGYANRKNKKGGACIVMYTVNASAAVKKSCPSCVLVKRQVATAHVSVPVRTVTSGRCHCHPAVRPSATNYRSRIRPVIAGYSIGYPGASGTAGLIVARGGQRFVLSNNHVLNRNNTSGYTETIQPGGADGGRSGRDRIGRLYRYVRLRRNAGNRMDAALSIPTSNRLLAPRYATVGRVPGVIRSYSIGRRLKKVGRSSGLAWGTVESIHTDIDVSYGNYGGLGTIRFQNQTVIRSTVPISLPGDSGSVWLTAGNYAAAVNFAGSANGRLSISYPVVWALQAFGVGIARATGRAGRSVAKAKRVGRTNTRTRPLSPAELNRVQTKKAASKRQPGKRRKSR
ncbi:hypothetical protein [Brevibacillus brevis]|uniref:hypothetical protein n=1 Tax=Brevibacillus brevis TaxID=1393 RepID=UPI0007D8BDD3|nr:hypothetical protein [Brevibacillus brevis]